MEPPLKSVFSIMDYRHNIPSYSEAMKYQIGISQEPKKFFNFDDNKVFVPGKNLDIPLIEVKQKNLKLK